MGILGALLGSLFSYWFFRVIGVADNMPPKVYDYGSVFCLVAFLIFVFMHRNADGTVRWTRTGTRPSSAPPRGKRTALLIAAVAALYWLLANLLHPFENLLSLARIVSCGTIAVLCVRYVLRWRKPDVNVD